MLTRFYSVFGLCSGLLLFIGVCACQCPPDQTFLSGVSLGMGTSIGLNSSGGLTNWLSTENGADFLMQYPSGQAWGSVFLTDGPAVATNRPGLNLSACKTLVVELSGAPGSTIGVGIKDSTQLDDGSEVKQPVTLSANFQTFMIPLSSFTRVDLTKVYVLAEFVFSESQSQTVRVRSVRYTSSSATVTKILPQFVFGGGWYTAIYLSNTGSAPVSIQINFFGDDGTSLNVPSIGSASTSMNLGAGATSILEAPNFGASTAEGYALILLPPEVIGYGVFRHSSPGNPDQEAVVPISDTTSTVSTLVWDNTQYATGIAVVNPSTTAATINMTVLDESGQTIGTPVLSLTPGTKQTFLLTGLGTLAGTQGHRGSAQFTATSGAVVVLGLRSNGVAITSIPTSAN